MISILPLSKRREFNISRCHWCIYINDIFNVDWHYCYDNFISFTDELAIQVLVVSLYDTVLRTSCMLVIGRQSRWTSIHAANLQTFGLSPKRWPHGTSLLWEVLLASDILASTVLSLVAEASARCMPKGNWSDTVCKFSIVQIIVMRTRTKDIVALFVLFVAQPSSVYKTRMSYFKQRTFPYG